MKLAVSGMTCQSCAAAVTKSSQCVGSGCSSLDGAVARQAIERAGSTVTGRVA